MAIKSSNQVSISFVADVASTCRYYKLQASSASAPSKPTTNPPSADWTSTEPTYTEGSTQTLYTVDLTVLTDNTFSYSDVSKSTSYEAAKAAYNKAVDAAKVATNYMDFQDGVGLVVGNMTDATLGKNTLIDSSGMAVRDGTTEYARFGANTITIGNNSASGSSIHMMNDMAIFSVRSDGALEFKSDELMSLYSPKQLIFGAAVGDQTADTKYVGITSRSIGFEARQIPSGGSLVNSPWMLLNADGFSISPGDYGTYSVVSPEKFRDAIGVDVYETLTSSSSIYDVDYLTTSGRYFCSVDVLNRPCILTAATGWLDVKTTNVSGTVYQRYQTVHGDTYERNMWGGTWEPWRGSERFNVEASSTSTVNSVTINLPESAIFEGVISCVGAATGVGSFVVSTNTISGVSKPTYKYLGGTGTAAWTIGVTRSSGTTPATLKIAQTSGYASYTLRVSITKKY